MGLPLNAHQPEGSIWLDTRRLLCGPHCTTRQSVKRLFTAATKPEIETKTIALKTTPPESQSWPDEQAKARATWAPCRLPSRLGRN